MIKEHEIDIQRLEIYGGEILIMDNILKIVHCGKYDKNKVLPFQIEISIYSIIDLAIDDNAIIIHVSKGVDKGSKRYVFYKTACVENEDKRDAYNFLHYHQFYAFKAFLCFLNTV